MRETIVNDCVDNEKTCSCGNKAVKEVKDPEDFITGKMAAYYCSDCFEKWKDSKEPNPEEDLDFLISKGIDPVEAEKMISLIHNRNK
ncbi:hypothetical protein AF332_11545 [Sporosarcina globispora]|uniref:Uncharacterized protein n=1 Tax=Sporosarcina globispora TaxID=1459 RepID=A0A0M0GCY5_SPOGL|nr:hypothetical protein [Sporosarcina globispora]KON87397.1 hypothetical protein AF332_11545 [Sporosarcina globispora]